MLPLRKCHQQVRFVLSTLEYIHVFYQMYKKSIQKGNRFINDVINKRGLFNFWKLPYK